MFRLLTRQVQLRPSTLETLCKSQTRNLSTDNELPKTADVVIIGGGVAGCSTLYHLSRLGINAVLVESSKINSGTTAQTAGLVWRLRPNDVEIQLLASTRNQILNMKEQTGIDPGWIENGGLYIAHNKERLGEYRRLITIGRSFGIESQLLSPSETKSKFPFINEEIIEGSLYIPGSGVVNPQPLCQGLIQEAVKNGAKIVEDCAVNNILINENIFGTREVTGVNTSKGVVMTDCVVNCAGAWAGNVSELAGLPIPVIPMKHSYIVSEPIEGVSVLPNIRDHDSSIYFRVQGDSLCLGGYESNPAILDQLGSDQASTEFELDWNVFDRHIQKAIELVPAFQKAGIKSTVCGAEAFTPDHKPLIGEDPRLRGMFHNCGFNSAGLMLSGGCAEQLASWILNGQPDLHMYNYDIRRFTKEQCMDKNWIKERSHESYVKNYSIVFPHDQPLAGRNFKKDPFHEKLLKEGAVYEEMQGWEKPGWFAPNGFAPIFPYDWYGSYGSTKNTDKRYENLLKGDYTFNFSRHHHQIGSECLSCREQVAMFNMSYYSKMYLSGPEAEKAADWLFTADTKQPIGKSVFTCLLNAKGNIEADAIVTVITAGGGGLVDPIFKGKGYYIVSGGASASQTTAHIKSAIRKKNFKVDLTDLTDKLGILSIQGPYSRELLQGITSCDLHNSLFPYMTSKLTKVAGHTVRALRTSFAGELGWQLHIPFNACEDVYNVVRQEGLKYGLRHAGYRALYSLSCEKGNNLWNFDIRLDDNPVEANLGHTCRRQGDYLGKSAVEKIISSGPKKKLCFFTLHDQIPVWGLETIWRNNQVVGYLRRGEYGYSLGCSIGMGYVSHPGGAIVTNEFLENGNYEIEVMGKNY